MRVTYILHGYPPRQNAGAETMAHAICRWLAERGHQVDVICRSPGPSPWEGIRVRKKIASLRYLALDLATANVVLTHLDETAAAAAAAQHARKPLVHVLHNDRQLDFHKVTYAALIVANSRWIQEAIPERLAAVPSLIVYPPTLDVVSLSTDTTNRDAITLVNATEPKGAPLFFDLARRNPHRRFLVVAGGYGKQIPPPPDLPNLAVVPNRPNMQPVWDQTRILLAPSSYESFGKAAIEAAARAIPVVAHPTPGLLESLSAAGIFADRDRPDAWQEAIDRLDNTRTYRNTARAVRTRALELEAITVGQLETFEAALLRRVP